MANNVIELTVLFFEVANALLAQFDIGQSDVLDIQLTFIDLPTGKIDPKKRRLWHRSGHWNQITARRTTKL